MAFDISHKAAWIKDYAERQWSHTAGKMTLRFIDENFRRQSWEGVPWKKRKYTQKSVGRALLIKTGQLRRGNQMIPSAGKVRIFNNVKYARVHNDGFYGSVQIPAYKRRSYGRFRVSSLATRRTATKRLESGISTVSAHTRKMRIPRRQFMPTASRPSPTLNRSIHRQTTLDLLKILKRT